MRSYAAGELEIFRRVRIPTALPFMFAGLKVATVLAMIGAIVGDYFGGSTNALGVQILNSLSSSTSRGWAGIVSRAPSGSRSTRPSRWSSGSTCAGIPSTRLASE